MASAFIEKFATIQITEVVSVDQEKGIKKGDVFPAIVAEFEGKPCWKVSFYHKGNACYAWIDNNTIAAAKHLTKCNVIEHEANDIVVNKPYILN